MIIVWVIVGLAALGAILAVVTSWRQRDLKADLGAVSNQWIAERRLAQTQDSQR